MGIEISNDFKLDLANLEQDFLLDLFDIDLTNLTAHNGERGQIYHLCNTLNEKGNNVVWKGVEYTAFPIKINGVSKTIQGTSNRPDLSISNVFGFVTSLVNKFDDCLGGIVTRRQVYADVLDPVNFESGVNLKHNPHKEIISKYTIEQLNTLAYDYANFKLCIPTELDNLKLPARMMMANTCQSRYRSSECGYTGSAMFTDKDQPTNDPKQDMCSKCQNGCKLRNNLKNFGAFIMIDNL